MPPHTNVRACSGRLLKWGLLGMTLLANILSSAPMITIGDTASIHVSAEAEFQYLSNVTLDIDPKRVKDDAVLRFTPGFSIGLFEESQITDFSIGAKRGMLHFMDNTIFNDEPWALYMNTKYDGYPFAFSMDWHKQEQLQNITQGPSIPNPSGSDLILQSIVEDFQINFDLSFSPKLGIRSGVQWHMLEYDPNSLNYGPDIFAIPFTFFYKISSKLESSVGYRFRTTEVDSIIQHSDHNDHYINLNLIGQATPKTYLHLTIGFQNRNSDYNSSNSITNNTFSSNIGVTYKATEKVQLEASFFRDFNVGSEVGESIEFSSFNTGATFFFTPNVFLSSKASVFNADYSQSGRDDLGASSRTFLTLAPNDSPWLYRVGYQYDWAEFDIPGQPKAEYTNHKISVSTAYEY